jgi:hypothetical protein
LPQYIQLTFTALAIPKRISLTFQGGFVGTRCAIYFNSEATGKKDWQLLESIYPEDVNRKQSFNLSPSEAGNIEKGATSLKLVFDQSSDFFGRITLYDLQLEGVLV